jgi:hypothetical protein
VMTLVGTKLTEREIDVLDWLIHRLGLPSRSEALRRCYLETAKRHGLRALVLAEIADERSRHPIRTRSRPGTRATIAKASGQDLDGPA